MKKVFLFCVLCFVSFINQAQKVLPPEKSPADSPWNPTLPPPDKNAPYYGTRGEKGSHPSVDSGSVLLSIKIAKGSPVANILNTIMKILGVLFFVVCVVSFYTKSMIGDINAVRPMEIMKYVGLFLVIIFYDLLLMKVVDPIFMGIINYITESNKSFSDQAINRFLDDGAGKEKGILSGVLSLVSGNTLGNLITGIFVYLVQGIDRILEWIFVLYANINLFFVQLFGPIFIVFSILPGCIGNFMTWLKMLLKFYVYLFIVEISIAVGHSIFMFYVKDLVEQHGTAITVSYLLSPAAWLAVAAVVLVFKVIFIMVGFKITDAIFSGQAGGGGGVGAMVGGAMKAGQMALTGTV